MLCSIDSADRLSLAADLVAAVALQIPEAISLVLRRSRLPTMVDRHIGSKLSILGARLSADINIFFGVQWSIQTVTIM
jgi:hypothetical protein